MSHKVILSDNDIERITINLNDGSGDIGDILIKIIIQTQTAKDAVKVLVNGKATHYVKGTGPSITLCGLEYADIRSAVPVTKLKVTCKECLRIMDLKLLNVKLDKKSPKKSEEIKHIGKLKNALPQPYQWIDPEFRKVQEKVTELIEVVNQLIKKDEKRLNLFLKDILKNTEELNHTGRRRT